MDPKISTSSYRIGRFKQHGFSEFRLEGDILFIDSIGPYNEETIAASAEALRTILGEAPPRHAEILTVTGSALMSPQALLRYRTLVDEFARAGLAPLATALVAGPEVEGIFLMRKLAAEVYAAAGLPFRYFERLDDARAWVAERLAR